MLYEVITGIVAQAQQRRQVDVAAARENHVFSHPALSRVLDPASSLGVQPSVMHRRRHARDADHERSHAVGHPLLLRQIEDFPKRPEHDALELPVHLLDVPEKLLRVLDPLEVGGRYPAGVSQEIGDA